MIGRDVEFVEAIRDALRAHATRLALDPASITSPSPAAIIRATDGALLRLDVRTYEPPRRSR